MCRFFCSFFPFLLLPGSCNNSDPAINFPQQAEMCRVGDIPLPEGYEREIFSSGSFAHWLRNLSLKKDNRVFLYNGTLKSDQSVQFAVLDIPVGNKDLQQCADAVMRLRAEYLFDQKKYDSILFIDNEGGKYQWEGGNKRSVFEKFLEKVFGWCGTASLEKQLKKVSGIEKIQPGDVFIKGGFPGHAMIVADVAINQDGNRIFLLAQSYMPAQDIHIVKNPVNTELSPWYNVNESAGAIITPEWRFMPSQLKQW